MHIFILSVHRMDCMCNKARGEGNTACERNGIRANGEQTEDAWAEAEGCGGRVQ